MFVVRIPSTWDGSAITFDPDWATGAGGAGTITTTPYSACLSPGNSVDSVTWHAGSNVTGTPGSGGYFQGATSLSVPLTGCAAGNLMFLAVARQAGDSYASSVYLLGGNLSIKY